ncbi:hypothetical protein FB567DRAFT_433926 [Paraphoma chrysanthemicola]|uniref:Uncharacterized protein n=1 Tax=Paraphoma chrysanthemicola TaxID=798071 RepID=A0A8K0REU1_9PLEO|nr:hypothetical protein FB567DRAFT_433926 [Paraphoma chrysanthemicola]
MIADIARRGLSHPNAVAFVKRAVTSQGDAPEGVEVPVWGGVLLYVTFMVAAVGISLLSYMLNEVITTLCMVESPIAAITVSPSTHEPADKAEKEGLLETGPTITLVNQKPITSSIRGTIKHLVAHAGRWARFRGFKIHILHSILFSTVSTFFSAALPRVPGQIILVAALSGATVANIHATWTHKVVSMPTDKSFCARLVPKSQWKTLAGPAAIEAAMPYISLYLTCGVAMLMGLHKLDQENIAAYSGAQLACLAVRLLVTFIFMIACTLFLCLPAIVTLVRIEASILPEDQDTIIPFDRSFGGKVVSQMHGGSGKIGFLDAWRSFNWEARRRLIKLFVKVFFIIAGLMFVVVHVLVGEMMLVFGTEGLGKALRENPFQN